MTDPARQRPAPTAGMHHVALYARNFEATRSFYVDLLGLDPEWEPDPDNVYLTSGTDNVAIHRAQGPFAAEGQRLDHIGFILDTPDDVDEWHAFLAGAGIEIVSPPRTHRDGARSFYCKDPDGTTVQMIFHPPLSQG